MTTNISHLLNIMRPKLLELKKAKIGFKQVFLGKILNTQEGDVVTVNDFADVLMLKFGDKNPEISIEEWREVA